jgi:uncharacterized membrane protein
MQRVQPEMTEANGPGRAVIPFALAVGLLFVFLTPPFHVPDEPAHFFRGYAVSEGIAFAVDANGKAGAVLPASLPAVAATLLGPTADLRRRNVSVHEIVAQFGVPLHKQTRLFLPDAPLRVPTPISFSALAYTPLLYLPAAVAIGSGRLLDAPPLVLLYAARVTNMIVGTMLLWIGLRAAPFGRWLAFSLAFFPMSTVLRSSASTDAILLPLVFAFLAGILRSRAAGRIPPLPAIVALAAAAFVMSAARPPYAVFGLAVLLAGGKVQGQASHRVGLKFGVPAAAAAGVVAAFGWIAAVPSPAAAPDVTIEGSTRLSQVFGRPFDFLLETWHHLATYGPEYAREMVGNLGWLDHPMPLWLTTFVACCAVVVAVIDGPAIQRIGAGARLWMAFVCCTAVLGVVGALHLGTPLEEGFVTGLQGRYFIPALWPFLLILGLGRVSQASRPVWLPYFVAAMTAAGLLGAVATTLSYYAA